MNKHGWTDPETGLLVEVTSDHLLVYRDEAPEITASAVRRELLRLAQREADLLAELAVEQAGRLAAVVTAQDWKRTAEERLGACDQLRARIAALEEGDERETRIVRLRDDLAAARRANEILGKRIQALERENRARTLEMAENAGRIRELEEALGKALSASGWHKRQADGLEVSNIALGHREREVEAAIEDAIAHVERATEHNRFNCEEIGSESAKKVQEQLDLAHEVLSAAVRADRGGAAPRVDGATAVPGVDPAKPGAERTVPVVVDSAGPVGLDERLAALERHLGQPLWTKGDADGLLKGDVANLLARVADHATMLTDHADRLAAMETTSVQHAERAMRGRADTDKRARLLEAAIDESARRWEDLAEIVERDGSYTNAGFLAASARRLRQALEAGKE